MKRILLTALIAGGCLSAQAQNTVYYQHPNGDFESWANDNEPGNHWNSFKSADGSLASTANGYLGGYTYKNTTKVTGYNNTGYAIKIVSKSTMKKNANGNFTTGRISMGSTTPASTSNYNRSVTSNDAYSLRFGQPDRVEFDAIFKSGGSPKGRGNFILHGNVDYRDPEIGSQSSSKYGQAIVYIEDTNSQWKHVGADFTYTADMEKPTDLFLLASFTTNETAGGSAGDELTIDNVKFIYYSTLSTLTYDGTDLLSKATTSTDGKTVSVDMSNTLYQAGKIAYTLKGAGAKVLSEKYDDKTGIYTIKVAGNDNVNNSNVTTYNIQFMKQVTIQTGKNIETTAGKAQVTMIRDFKQGWNTVCLPFLTEVSTLGASKAQEFTAGDNQSVTFTEVSDGKLKANTPYLVFFTTAKSFTSSNPFTAFVDLQDSKSATVTHGAFTFSGNYKAGMNMNGLYGVANVNGKQRLCKGGASATLPEGCAYFTTTNAKANSFAINFDGQTTGIADATIANDETRAAVYNLQGIKVSTNGTTSLPAGIYIQGGRKVIVK